MDYTYNGEDIGLLGMKAYDIITLDYILLTKTQFFQHYIPETKGCAGYHSFGYNRKEQLTRILTLFAALLTAWVCTLLNTEDMSHNK